MFYDFSSAFNTIQPHLLADKLMQHKNINAATVRWILNYLTNRPQYVELCNTIKSDVMFTNTGALQGTVLASFLFSMYTADWRSSHTDCIIDKYADDIILTGLITDDDEPYRQEMDSFVQWCERKYLELHEGKTREIIMDFRRIRISLRPLSSDGKRWSEL